MKTNNISGLLSYVLYCGFNFHAVHHLFPTIDNHYLPLVDKILVEEAAKIGIRKNLVKSMLEGMIKVESNFLHRKIWKNR